MSLNAHIKVHIGEFSAAQLPHGCSPSPAAPSVQPSLRERRDSRCLRGAGRGPRRSFATRPSVRVKHFICQESEAERQGFAATVWKSQRLSLTGLKTALQTERALHPREVGKYVPHPVHGETEVKRGEVAWTHSKSRRSSTRGRSPASQCCYSSDHAPPPPPQFHLNELCKCK